MSTQQLDDVGLTTRQHGTQQRQLSESVVESSTLDECLLRAPVDIIDSLLPRELAGFALQSTSAPSAGLLRQSEQQQPCGEQAFVVVVRR